MRFARVRFAGVSAVAVSEVDSATTSKSSIASVRPQPIRAQTRDNTPRCGCGLAVRRARGLAGAERARWGLVVRRLVGAARVPHPTRSSNAWNRPARFDSVRAEARGARGVDDRRVFARLRGADVAVPEAWAVEDDAARAEVNARFARVTNRLARPNQPSAPVASAVSVDPSLTASAASASASVFAFRPRTGRRPSTAPSSVDDAPASSSGGTGGATGDAASVSKAFEVAGAGAAVSGAAVSGAGASGAGASGAGASGWANAASSADSNARADAALTVSGPPSSGSASPTPASCSADTANIAEPFAVSASAAAASAAAAPATGPVATVSCIGTEGTA
ncbi:MAG: hypothetical protein AAGA11_15555 [Pseudomonadota bacterium]